MSSHTGRQKTTFEKILRILGNRRIAWATIAVTLSMMSLFLVPHAYFVILTFIATSVMIAASYLTGNLQFKKPLHAKNIFVGTLSALVLYAIFYLGNIGVNLFLIPGFEASGEASIYSLISSPSNPLELQVVLLLFDAVGYEAFFRGVLQKNLNGRLGLGAAPMVAMFDALLHVATLNPLWVGTTFVADLCWGLTYRYGRGLQASVSSHYLWDITIFILRPIV